jgi:hypothetical protein
MLQFKVGSYDGTLRIFWYRFLYQATDPSTGENFIDFLFFAVTLSRGAQPLCNFYLGATQRDWCVLLPGTSCVSTTTENFAVSRRFLRGAACFITFGIVCSKLYSNLAK